MKITTLAALTATAALVVSTAAPAATISSGTLPATDVLASYTEAANTGSQATFAFRAADAAGTEGTRGRGQSFIIDAGTAASYNIAAISLVSASARTIPANAVLDLYVFEIGSDAEIPATGGWVAGDGGQDGDALDGTGYTALVTQTIDISGLSITAGNTVTANFAVNELVFEEDTAYGIFYQYRITDLTGVTTDQTIQFQVSTTSDAIGDLLNTDASSNAFSGSRDMRFVVQGTPVPEPGSLALLGLGGLLIARRRRAS